MRTYIRLTLVWKRIYFNMLCKNYVWRNVFVITEQSRHGRNCTRDKGFDGNQIPSFLLEHFAKKWWQYYISIPLSKKAYRYNSISEKIAFFIKNVLWYSLLSSNGWQVNLGLILLANMGSSFDLPCALNHPFFFIPKILAE